MTVVSVSLFFLYFLCLWSLELEVISAEKLFCLLCKAVLKVSYLIITLWISLEKLKCFDSNHSLGCNNQSFSLLIWYPCLSIFFRLFLTFFQFFHFLATFPWCLKFHASICWSRVTFRFWFLFLVFFSEFVETLKRYSHSDQKYHFKVRNKLEQTRTIWNKMGPTMIWHTYKKKNLGAYCLCTIIVHKDW